MNPRVLVIGIGNEFRGDDAAGVLVARQVRARVCDAMDVREHAGDGVSLMQAWCHAEHVFLIDAVSSGGAVGTVYRFDARSHQLPRQFFAHSTHTVGVAEAIALARLLNQLPAQLIVYGIEAQNFVLGAPLSPAVAQVVPAVADAVAREVDALVCRTGTIRQPTAMDER